MSWLCARTVKETLRSHIFLTIWCSRCVRYKSTRHLLCHMFYDHTLAEIWMSPDVCINYRLTRARRKVKCASGIVCNKWRIFHRAIDGCPDFCDVTVKTCCILHNFVRQRDGFQFRNTLCECLLVSIKADGTRGNVIGTDVWRRAQGTGISVGGPLGSLAGN
jgi:hypothetical protein